MIFHPLLEKRRHRYSILVFINSYVLNNLYRVLSLRTGFLVYLSSLTTGVEIDKVQMSGQRT